MYGHITWRESISRKKLFRVSSVYTIEFLQQLPGLAVKSDKGNGKSLSCFQLTFSTPQRAEVLPCVYLAAGSMAGAHWRG